MAADGYHRATGRSACVAVTSGPGVQNVLNGVCGCFYDSVPALVISGQVNMSESLDAITARPRQVGFQETPVIDCYRPFTKYAAKITEAAALPRHLHAAVASMTDGRPGPALLDFPVNLQMTDVSVEQGACPSVAASFQNQQLTSKDADHLLCTISASSRPLLVIGNGARDEAPFLNELIAACRLPTVVSWGGMDVVQASAPTYYGTIGVYGSRVANFAVQNADLLIVLGSRLDTRQTGGNLARFSVASHKIMVDVDAHEMAKLDERGVPIHDKYVMSVSSFVAQFLRPHAGALAGATSSLDAWRDKVASWQATYLPEHRDTPAGSQSPYDVMDAIKAGLPDDAIVAVDTGATLVWAFQTLTAGSPRQRIFSNLGNSSMGFALPAAIGAALGRPDGAPVVCITGDGGFQQNIQELVTARQLGLNIKVFVFNNSGYGIIKQFQNAYLHGRHTATSSDDIYGHARTVDFVAVAGAYGVAAERVTEPSQLTPKLLAAPGLVVYDVVIHPDHGIRPKLEFGNSLENMSPFVESAADMLVPPPDRRSASGWVKM